MLSEKLIIVVDDAFRKFGHCDLADMVSERWLSWTDRLSRKAAIVIQLDSRSWSTLSAMSDHIHVAPQAGSCSSIVIGLKRL
jgi:hypothetical protein